MGKKAVVFIVAIFLFISGCASTPIVQPTFEEYEAARLQKKTVAVVEISELGSSIEGVGPTIISKIESVMVNKFNVVERKRLGPIYEERRFQGQDDVQQKVEFGKILGADFVLYGTCTASFLGPKTTSSHSTNDKGEFVGKVWDEVQGLAEVTIKVVDVRNGVIHSSLIGSGKYTEKLNSSTFTNEADFNRVSAFKSMASGSSVVEDRTSKETEQRGLFAKNKQAQTHKTKIIAKDYSSLEKSHEVILAMALGMAARNVGAKFVKKYGGLDAQVVRIVSDSEVMINIGSAFGVRPGMRVTVWEEGEEIIDPRTGLTIRERRKKGVLKVKEVTSGLSCIAKGSKKLIRKIRVGDFLTL